MRPPSIALVALLAIFAVTAAGCERRLPTTPGPVALRDTGHLATYLASASAWKRHGTDPTEQFWSFAPDGTCRAWILPLDAPTRLAAILGMPDVPDDATLISATWNATETALTLTSVRTDTGVDLPDAELPLRWLDGKLRIEIAGHQYLRASK